MDVHLLRHPRAALETGICYGRLDVPLKSGWEPRIDALRAQLPAAAQLLCCGAMRNLAPAQRLAGAARAPTIDPRLRELDFGAWEGVAWADIPGLQSSHWAKDIWERSPPQGESYAALHARVAAAWQALVLLDTEAVIVVGSAGPLRALLTIALELPAEAFVRLQIDHGGHCCLTDAAGGWRLEYANR